MTKRLYGLLLKEYHEIAVEAVRRMEFPVHLTPLRKEHFLSPNLIAQRKAIYEEQQQILEE